MPRRQARGGRRAGRGGSHRLAVAGALARRGRDAHRLPAAPARCARPAAHAPAVGQAPRGREGVQARVARVGGAGKPRARPLRVRARREGERQAGSMAEGEGERDSKGYGWQGTVGEREVAGGIGGAAQCNKHARHPTGELGHGCRRRFHVPNADVFIQPTGREKTPIRGVGESLDIVGVAVERV
jgi:hypothetical protein